MYYTIGGELIHHQRLGAKWGVMHGPPYPLGRGAFSKRGTKLKSGNVIDYLKARKKKKRQAAALEKARKTRSENIEKRKSEEERAAEREKALKSGSAEDIMKFKGEFTAQQLQDALNRLSNESKLAEMAKKDVKTTTDKVDEIIKKIDKVANWTTTGINAYNKAAKIINAFSDDSELPIIGERSKKKIMQDNNTQKLNDAIKKLTAENNVLKNKAQKQDVKAKKLENKRQKMVNKWIEQNGPLEQFYKSTDGKKADIVSDFGKVAENHKNTVDDILKKVNSIESKPSKKEKKNKKKKK